MAPGASYALNRRYEECTLTEDGFIDENSCYVPFWSTRTGIIVKWSLFLGIIVFLSLYLLLGYMHAQKRLKKGLLPLRYHRFLVSRAQLAQVDPRYRPQPSNMYPYTPEQHYYNMHAMPPPMYDPTAPRPPMYEPPAGATKAGPHQQAPDAPQAQHQSGQGSDYAPPPGPPPSAIQPQETGVTNPTRG
ncbi:hypothetical protein B0J18DRAFT_252294 [Chaetomium sp. MPI-SDFR-AT-0129]|nr:hypothetical protein B0J18DRAFT_252294 [Chaetomium sp. MPI-SDFR-AT-0129]